MPLDAAQLSKLKSEVHLGKEIAALIDNQTVKKALDGLIHGLQNEWLVTPTAIERELLWQKGVGVQEFVAALRSIVDTGKMAAAQLELEERMRGEHDQEN
jgi:hypothetical protein